MIRNIHPDRVETTNKLRKRVKKYTKNYKGSFQAVANVAGKSEEEIRRIFKDLTKKNYFIQESTAKWLNETLDKLEKKDGK